MYEMILNALLDKDDMLFFETIKEWERGRDADDDLNNSLDGTTKSRAASFDDVFDVKTIISRVRAILIERESPILQDALAELYKLDGQYDLALREYLERTAKSKYQGLSTTSNRSERVFEMIETHNLFHAIQDKILSLVDLDEARAIDLLVDAFTDGVAEPIVEVSTVAAAAGAQRRAGAPHLPRRTLYETQRRLQHRKVRRISRAAGRFIRALCPKQALCFFKGVELLQHGWCSRCVPRAQAATS